jgi:hypothetical protein
LRIVNVDDAPYEFPTCGSNGREIALRIHDREIWLEPEDANPKTDIIPEGHLREVGKGEYGKGKRVASRLFPRRTPTSGFVRLTRQMACLFAIMRK